MIRRLLSLMLACMLALGCTAYREFTVKEHPEEVWRRMDGTPDEPIGTAVLLLNNQTLLSSAAALARANTAVDLAGRQYALSDLRTDGVISLAAASEAIAADPLRLAPRFDLNNLYCLGVSPTGEFQQSDVTRPAVLLYRGHAAIVFSAAEDMIPGAILIDDDGGLCGLVVASYGEGQGRYVAYTNEGLYFALLSLEEHADLSEGDGDDNPEGWLSGVTMNWEAGTLTVDWSDAIAAGEADADSRFLVYMKDLGNDYYRYTTTEPGATSCTFYAIPGRTYAACVRVSAADDDDVFFSRTHCAVCAPIPVEPFTLYDFTNDTICVSVVPSKTFVDETDELTAPDAIMDLYLQVASHYSTIEVTDHPLFLALITPDDQCFTSFSGYTFVPELMSHDAWHAPINDLFADYLTFGRTGTLIPGTYTVAFYIDGLLADQTSFTLE